MWPSIGSWGLPDFGITEWAANKLSGGKTTDLSNAILGKPQAAGQVAGATTGAPRSVPSKAPSSPGTPPPSSGSSGGSGGSAPVQSAQTAPSSGGGGRAITEQEAEKNGWDVNNLPNGFYIPGRGGGGGIDGAADSQKQAAAAAAEARRVAAQAKYEAQKKIAERSKETAKGQYDWLINTLGSNKTDLLEQVALNEKQGLDNYAQQEAKTKDQYSKSRQEILSTYRDLGLQQEKLMRGAGQGQSSRSLEATTRLNGLLGKDISQVSTNEADSLALIGNALTSFKEKTLGTKNSIEREAKTKADKATLDYNDQIKAIDSNLDLSEAEKEGAYAEAESKLKQDTAAVDTWAAQQKLAAEQTNEAMKAKFNDYIATMTDANGLLNKDLTSKKAATNSLLEAMGYTTLDKETDATAPTSGNFQKAVMSYKDKASLDRALNNGDITPTDYQMQLQRIQQQGTTAPTSLRSSMIPQGVQRDPLLASLFA